MKLTKDVRPEELEARQRERLLWPTRGARGWLHGPNSDRRLGPDLFGFVTQDGCVYARQKDGSVRRVGVVAR